jgi:NADPH:quinone reductase-like Zn-dependent oxidoreductase
MRTYRMDKLGSLDGLVAHEEPTPTPGLGEVLVRVKATAVNFRDIFTLKGQSPFPVKSGVIPMSDASGEVAAVGPGVTRFQVGDRVVNAFFRNWYGGPRAPNLETYGSDHDGWLAEFKVVGADALSLAPRHLTFEEAATLPCVAVTAWSALAGVRAGDTVLTQGAGGVAVFALQLAKLLGARVITTARSAAEGGRLKKIGADGVVDYVANPEWADAVRGLTGGRGVDRVVEVGGPGTLAQSIKAAAYGGEISLVGALAAGGSGIDFMSVFMNQVTLRCISVGSRSDMEALLRAVDSHAMHPVVDRVFPFAEAKAAWEHYAGGHVFGKVVIRH